MLLQRKNDRRDASSTWLIWWTAPVSGRIAFDAVQKVEAHQEPLDRLLYSGLEVHLAPPGLVEAEKGFYFFLGDRPAIRAGERVERESFWRRGLLLRRSWAGTQTPPGGSECPPPPRKDTGRRCRRSPPRRYRHTVHRSGGRKSSFRSAAEETLHLPMGCRRTRLRGFAFRPEPEHGHPGPRPPHACTAPIPDLRRFLPSTSTVRPSPAPRLRP